MDDEIVHGSVLGFDVGAPGEVLFCHGGRAFEVGEGVVGDDALEVGPCEGEEVGVGGLKDGDVDFCEGDGGGGGVDIGGGNFFGGFFSHYRR